MASFHAALVVSVELTPEDAEAMLEGSGGSATIRLLETIVANAGLGDDARQAGEVELQSSGRLRGS